MRATTNCHQGTYFCQRQSEDLLLSFHIEKVCCYALHSGDFGLIHVIHLWCIRFHFLLFRFKKVTENAHFYLREAFALSEEQLRSSKGNCRCLLVEFFHHFFPEFPYILKKDAAYFFSQQADSHLNSNVSSLESKKSFAHYLSVGYFCQRIHHGPRPFRIFHKKLRVLRWGGFSPLSNPQAGRSPPVGCLRLLIQYIRSYPPHLQAVSSIRNVMTRHAVVTGDPLNMAI
jgi:hypothetical protein